MEATNTNLTTKENVSYLASLLHNLSTQAGVIIPNRNHLLKEMYNISHFAFKATKGHYPLPFILFDAKKSFVQSVDELFPDFIKAAFTTLKAYEKKIQENYSDSARYEIIYTLIVQWKHLIPELYDQKNKVHLLIVSDLDFEHAQMIQDLLHHYFKQEITTELFTRSTLSFKQIKKQPHDILITTFTLVLEDELSIENCVCIQNIPTKHNLECIRQVIEKQYKLKSPPSKSLVRKFGKF